MYKLEGGGCMNLRKAKAFGESGALILLSFTALLLIMLLFSRFGSLFFARISAYIWMVFFKDTLFYNLLISLISLIGLILIGTGIIYMLKHYSSKKILVLFSILFAIFIIEAITKVFWIASFTQNNETALYHRLANLILTILPISRTYLGFYASNVSYYPIIGSIFVFITLLYLTRVSKIKSFFFSGASYLAGKSLISILIIIISTTHLSSPAFNLAFHNSFETINLFVIEYIILLTSYILLLRGFLRLENSRFAAILNSNFVSAN
jgi:hypothetical protein